MAELRGSTGPRWPFFDWVILAAGAYVCLWPWISVEIREWYQVLRDFLWRI
jgi:hypothetical protein